MSNTPPLLRPRHFICIPSNGRFHSVHAIGLPSALRESKCHRRGLSRSRSHMPSNKVPRSKAPVTACKPRLPRAGGLVQNIYPRSMAQCDLQMSCKRSTERVRSTVTEGNSQASMAQICSFRLFGGQCPVATLHCCWTVG